MLMTEKAMMKPGLRSQGLRKEVPSFVLGRIITEYNEGQHCSNRLIPLRFPKVLQKTRS